MNERETTIGITWKAVGLVFPEFVQWAVARHGPLPEGEVNEEEYTRLAAEYTAFQGG